MAPSLGEDLVQLASAFAAVSGEPRRAVVSQGFSALLKPWAPERLTGAISLDGLCGLLSAMRRLRLKEIQDFLELSIEKIRRKELRSSHLGHLCLVFAKSPHLKELLALVPSAGPWAPRHAALVALVADEAAASSLAQQLSGECTPQLAEALAKFQQKEVQELLRRVERNCF